MEQVIDFALHEFEYDEKDVEEFKKTMKRKRPPPKKEAPPNDVALDNAPYLLNNQP